jgi:hypothetical protein
MPVRYITTGNEFAAKGLLGEGRHQLSILKNAMSFQNLKQLQRTVRFNDGVAIRCTSVFGQDKIEVFVPVGIPAPIEERKIVAVEYCWCNNYFTEGTIIRIIGDYGDVGEYGEETYPDYCNSDDVAVKNYNGIRYEVELCQGIEGEPVTYICLPSDFAEYEVGDEVIVFMRGVWDETILSEPDGREPGITCVNSALICDACEGTTRPDRTDDEADGSYLISPLEISGVNT